MIGHGRHFNRAALVGAVMTAAAVVAPSAQAQQPELDFRGNPKLHISGQDSVSMQSQAAAAQATSDADGGDAYGTAPGENNNVSGSGASFSTGTTTYGTGVNAYPVNQPRASIYQPPRSKPMKLEFP